MAGSLSARGGRSFCVKGLASGIVAPGLIRALVALRETTD